MQRRRSIESVRNGINRCGPGLFSGDVTGDARNVAKSLRSINDGYFSARDWAL